MKKYPEGVFKAYDIRGLAEKELDSEFAYRLGFVVGDFVKKDGRFSGKKKIVVGYDMRSTSVGYAEAVCQGVAESGFTPVDIGLVSTPVFNFACMNFPECAVGIMVTASHNPAEYNGFKITLSDGIPIGEKTGMNALKAGVNDFQNSFVPNTVAKETYDPISNYKSKLFSIVNPADLKPIKAVVDCGNGMGGAILPQVLEGLNIEVEYLYQEPDGSFPNHEANPLKTETLAELQKKVLETGANFGFAMDGDADRIGVVDENGKVLEPSVVGALVGKEILKKRKGLMDYDLRSSKMVSEVWKAAGGEPEMCMVGHANIKKQMKDNGAVFASELSLHLYYSDLNNVESSDLSFLYVWKILSESERPFSELVAELPRYAHSGEINFKVKDKEAAIKKVEEKFAALAVERNEIDGLWLKFDWGWFNLRQSNTEPLLRLNLETDSAELTEQKVKEISLLISGSA